MSLQAKAVKGIPEETRRVASQAFKKGNVYMTIGDQIGYLFEDAEFEELYAVDGSPAISPALLSLVTIFQFMEKLPDRQAAEQVIARIDWKYALHLSLADPGFDFSVLSDFRERLVKHEGGLRIFKRVLERLVDLELLKQGGKQRTDATYVLSAVRDLSRVELVAETMRLALEAVAVYEPEWLRSVAQSHWYERYNRILTTFRLPRGKQKQQELAFGIGADGFYLLDRIQAKQSPVGLAQLPEIEVLKQVWEQQFKHDEQRVTWRTPKEMPPGAEQIATPHDPQARHTARKRQSWTGYQVHLSETCDPDQPHLITHVETKVATTAEITVLDEIHQALAQKKLLPKQHLVDNGYMAGHALVKSKEHYGLDLIGPIGDDSSWQARQPDGLTADQFQIDWSQQQAICPAGHASRYWSETSNQYGHPTVHIQFAKNDCLACSARSRCTQATNTGRTLHLSLHFEAIVKRRQEQKTDAFKRTYAQRAGIEGTISAAVRAHGARRSRYIGHSKTALQELLIASAINLKRAARWLMGDRPGTTRPPGLSCLAPA